VTSRAAEPKPVDVASTTPGYIDFYGYLPSADGWLLCGWVPLPGPRAALQLLCRGTARIVFEAGELQGDVVLARFERADLADRGVGVILFLAASERVLGRLVAVDLRDAGPGAYRLLAAAAAPQLHDVDLASRLRPILNAAIRDEARTRLLALLSRRGYSGEDTLDRLTDFVRLDIDEAILCPPDGLVLIGWLLAAPGTVQSIHIHHGANVAALRPQDFVVVERGDVIEAMGQAHGFTDLWCGFVAFVPDMAATDDAIYIQIETQRREIGFKTVPPHRLRGMPAMRRILDSFEVQYDDVVPALRHVIAPAINRLNRARMQERPAVTEMAFGSPPAAPRTSIIVPLYGRIDFMEYQIGLLAAQGGSADSELIYVLDDPPKRRALQALAESLYLRFGMPFRLVMLSHNMGYAPANNIGLAHANGTFVCFLNSDVFPGTPDWIGRLVARLQADPALGAVGPLLLFEDGSVQHEGMTIEPIPALGGLRFALHVRKGWRPRAVSGLVLEAYITGACLVMRRALAQELGGFDEAYAIGDFEDTDLCLKIGRRGLVCAVDHDVQLYHLERQSQDGAGRRWRMNMTLANAWLHHCRWFAEPDAGAP
jgi:GT2 family glycosyltransferase